MDKVYLLRGRHKLRERPGRFLEKTKNNCMSRTWLIKNAYQIPTIEEAEELFNKKFLGKKAEILELTNQDYHSIKCIKTLERN